MPASKVVGNKDTTNLSLYGRVPRGMTSSALTTVPFPSKKFVNFEYTHKLTAWAPGALVSSLHVASNDMYDFDRTGLGYFGNKQPLYYDTLLSSTGPYRGFRVHSWVLTFTVVNVGASPITVYGLPSTGATAETDAVAEWDNFPGIKRIHLTGTGGSKSIGSITIKGALTDVYPYDKHSPALAGLYNASPSAAIYNGIGISNEVENISVQVAVKATFYTELGNIDALVS